MSDHSTPPLTPSRSPSPIAPVQPDHFYSPDVECPPLPPSPDSSGPAWLSPDDDPLATRGIPVFKPTMDDFLDFESYMKRVECWGMKSGIVKVVPPKAWTDALPSLIPQLANVRVKTPIEQHMLGRSGLYRQQNIEKRKIMSVREWAGLCAKEDLRAPGVDDVGLKAPAEKKERRRKKGDTVKDDVVVVKEEEPEMDIITRDMDGPMAGDPDIEEASSHREAEGQERHHSASADQDVEDDKPEDEPTKQRRRRLNQTRAEREASLAKRAQLDEEFLSDFDPHSDWLPPNTTPHDYTPDFCSTLERRYWRNCGLGKPPWYGADTAGSIFSEETTNWNVAHLDSALSRLLPTSNGLPGVNTPYLYFGMWRATFAWHVEDMDLFSINYIHFGAPKFWYAIPQGKSVQLENTMRSYFPRDVSKCRQFLRHKSFLASPTLLSQSSCKPNTLVQHSGEFVITFPRGYHAGFNLGFNCAESVNFALDSWLDIGRKAQVCGCVGDSVRIDVDALLNHREREREEEAQSALKATKLRPSKPKSSDSSSSKTPRKRKAEEALSAPKVRRVKVRAELAGAEVKGNCPPSKIPKVTLRLPAEFGPFPCCLCVSQDESGLLPVHDVPGPWSGAQNTLPRDEMAQEIWRAHEKCAMIVPETWVDEVPVAGEDGAVGSMEKVVFGVDAIVKDRWHLKCSSCQKTRRKIHGAPIQCTKGKCPKAFHVSCAREAEGVAYDDSEIVSKDVILNYPLPRQDGTEVDPSTLGSTGKNIAPSSEPADARTSTVGANKDDAILFDRTSGTPQPNVIKSIKKISCVVLCSQHNPEVSQQKRAKRWNKARAELLAMPEMSRIKIRVSAGVFEVSLVRLHEDRDTVEVVWDNGTKKEFKTSSVVWGKIDAVGQKPTEIAPPPPPPDPTVATSVFHALDLTPLNNAPFTSGHVTMLSNPQNPLPSTYTYPPIRPAPPSGAAPTVPYTYAGYSPPSGKLPYGSGAFGHQYYPPPSIRPAPTSSALAQSFVSPYSRPPTQGTYGITPYIPYPYTAPVSQSPFSNPLGQPLFTTFSVTTGQPAGHQVPQSVQQAVASSVASLPPKTKCAASSASSQPSDTSNLRASSTSVIEGQSQTSETSERSQSASASANPSPPLTAISPDMQSAIIELQQLLALEPAQLQHVLNSRPALRQAVTILLSQ